MKISMIGTLPPLKGLSPYCSELSKELSKKIFVEFINFKKLYPNFLYPGGTTSQDNEFKKPKFENGIIRNSLTYYNPFSWIWTGLTLKGDIVHAQWWAHPLAPIYFTILLISKFRGKKNIITVHNVLPHEKGGVNKFLNSIILSLGNEFIVHSNQNKETLSLFYKIDKNKINVIPHGILIPAKIKNISKETARKYLKIQKNKKVILYFGNIRDYKGLDDLILSMKEVVAEIPEATLIIAGRPWKDWDNYQRLIEENNLENNIIKKLDFIPQSEVEYYFSASDVVVLPYKYFDSQSGVGALALPFKKPLIVTNTGSLPDFVKDKKAIAEPNNPKDLSEKIIAVLKDEKLLAKLSNGSAELCKKYNWKDIAEETVKIYEKRR